MDNMRYYDAGRAVPKDALKAFSNGRFSGTDINPMWRIKKLTEMFGPAGIGWYTEVTRQEVVKADDDNMMVFVDVNLYVKEGGEWSKPIFGTGGNTLKAKGRGDDEGYKKAYTDAVSIACKALGIGADVWYANDTTSKYSDKYVDKQPEQPQQRGSKEAAEEAGLSKLDKVNAQLKAMEETKKATPVAVEGVAKGWATEEQKKYIRENADDELYVKSMEHFGAELEKLTAIQANKLIARIEAAKG